MSDLSTTLTGEHRDAILEQLDLQLYVKTELSIFALREEDYVLLRDAIVFIDATAPGSENRVPREVAERLLRRVEAFSLEDPEERTDRDLDALTACRAARATLDDQAVENEVLEERHSKREGAS
ncbi:MAG: hypothetical protein WKF33_07675 [Thermoleophilaceae bacterium]